MAEGSPNDNDATDQRDDETEVLLTGGIANAGSVYRVGSTVRRPRKPQSETIQAFLEHLYAHDFTEAPHPLGFDAQGREVLGFIEGVCPAEPYEPWATSDALLIQVAQTQRRLHLVAASFRPPNDAIWGTGGDYFPPGSEGGLVCHNDLGLSNIVVGNGRLRGVIDFDYIRPVEPLFDIAVAIRHWAPFAAPEDLDPIWGGQVAQIRRFRTFCEIHELDHDERLSVVMLATKFLVHAQRNIASLASGGHAGFQRLIASGYLYRNANTVTWLRDNTNVLAGAF